MSKIILRKYQMKIILRHIKEDMKLNTIDEILNDIDKNVNDDNTIVIEFDDKDLDKIKSVEDLE